MSRPTFLIDSSLIPAAVGASTPDHVKEFESAVAGGKQIITVYIRMEVIRRVICDLIRMAQMADQCDTVQHFWYYYQQAFEQRKLKTAIFAFGLSGSSLGQAKTPRALAEELVQQAIGFLKLVDRKLTQDANPSHCQIGGRKLSVDYNNLIHDAGQFLLDFSKAISNCEVNAFLRLDNPRSSSNTLIADLHCQKTSVIENLRSIKEERKWITCHECKKIGDAVIALEQPNRTVLVNGDKETYAHFCRVLKKKQVYVRSVQATEHAKSGFVFKLAGKLPAEMPKLPST